MEIYSTAILLFLIMDPLGNMPIFISVLKTVPPRRRAKILMREMLIALFILVVFLFVGDSMLKTLHLRQEAVSIAGAIILFIIAIKMIFPPSRGGGIMGDTPDGEPFIVPLATPLIAGPSILATLILLGNQHPGEQGKLVTALLIAWGISAAILLCSGQFMRVLGNRGVFAIERLMGMILVMLSVQMFMDGIANYLG
ncbi:YhgN family NAAT transporter [Endozoicomonas arenosclerae]|uniref:YhgN family NAAT transporter n=1 Tax=Endozoicomonas arenosclerae TaxID=1633495 RepID=UPI000B11ACED